LDLLFRAPTVATKPVTSSPSLSCCKIWSSRSPRDREESPRDIQILLAAAPPAVSLPPEPTADSRTGHRPSTEFRYLVGIRTPIEPHYAMTTPTSIARTAPIAIAARRPRTDTSLELPNNNTNGRGHLSASMSSTTSAESGTNTRSRKDRPCDACRRRTSRCVINEGQTSCVLCQFHTQECTFVQSPQPRKRKLNTEGKEESVAKRRCAKTKLSCCSGHFPPCNKECLCMLTMTNTLRAIDLPIERTREREDLRSRVCRALELPIR
jgi:hypothetical protein